MHTYIVTIITNNGTEFATFDNFNAAFTYASKRAHDEQLTEARYNPIIEQLIDGLLGMTIVYERASQHWHLIN